MPQIDEKLITPQTVGSGVFNVRDFQQFSAAEETVVRAYGEDQDMSIVVWNLEPGQENSPHLHPENAHMQIVLEGSGVYLRGNGEPVPIQVGQFVIVPRGTAHGIRNTGATRLPYLAVTTRRDGKRVREEAGQGSGH